jgi:hypothetical protein
MAVTENRPKMVNLSIGTGDKSKLVEVHHQGHAFRAVTLDS